jgi:hypothetical protein
MRSRFAAPAGLTALAVSVALALSGAAGIVGVAGGQYEEEVLVCINGFAEQMVSPEIAATLVAAGVAEYGPCPQQNL